MCDPLTATAMAIGAGGSYINSQETANTQRDMVNARNAATRAEMERQRAFQETSGKLFDKSLNNFSPDAQAQSLNDAQSSVTDAFKANAPISVGSVSSGVGPTVVKTAEDNTVAGAFSRGSAKDAALGKLSGWDQRAFGNNIKLNDSGRDLDQNTDFAKTSAGISGLEQTAAYNNAFKPNSGIGDIMQFAGSVGAHAGGKGTTFGSLFAAPKAGANFNNPAVLSGRGLY